MTKNKKIGIILLLIGLCLPSATLPFITEFRPVPEICLTSNFFQNMGNMIVVFGSKQMNISGNHAGTMYNSLITIRLSLPTNHQLNLTFAENFNVSNRSFN